MDRNVKPPIIFGDVSRPGPMTVRWSTFAQSLSDRPMKGMLTGPVTILNWSFVRDDQPRAETCRQIALAIRDEVTDLEAAGIGVIQIDEPALREGLPLRMADWPAYLGWAVTPFTSVARVEADATIAESVLEPANTMMEPLVYRPGDPEPRILGRVVGVLRKL